MRARFFMAAWFIFLAAPLLGWVPGTSGLWAAEDNSASSDSAPADAATLDFANGLYARKMYDAAVTEYRKYIRDNPDAPDAASAKFRYADSYYFLKEYDKAIGYFRMFCEEYPSDARVPIALFRAGTARYYLNRPQEAIRTFWKVFDGAEDPNLRSGALYYLGKCYQDRQKPDKSLEVLLKLIREYPQSEYTSYAGLMVGDHYLKAHAVADAVKGYQAAVSPNSPPEIAGEASFKIAEVYFGQKDYTNAKEYYRKIFEGTPGGAAAGLPENQVIRTLKEKSLLGLFYCDYNLQDLESAKSRLEANKALVNASATKPEIFYLLAGLLADKKDFDLALKLLDEAFVVAAAAKDNAMGDKILFKRAQVLAAKGTAEPALAEIQKIFDRKSKDLDRAYFEKAVILQEAGRQKEALENYAAAFRDFPDRPYGKRSLYQSALLYLKTSDVASARERFALYIKKYPSDPDTERAELEILQTDLDAKDFEEASRRARDFIKNYPASELTDIADYKLGVALTGLGKYDQAAEAFRAVTVQSPVSKLYAEALYGIAGSYENKKDLKTALLFYERFLKECPDHAFAKELLSRLGFLYIAAGDLEKASAFYQDVVLHKQQVVLDTDGVFWLVRYLLDHGSYEALQQVLEALPGRMPGQNLDHEINFFKGEASMGLQDYKKAAEFYSRSVTLKKDGPFAPYAFLGMGLAYASLGDEASAEKNFMEVMRYDAEPKVTVRAHFEIANAKLRQKKIDDAAKAFMRVAILYDDVKYAPLALYKAGECFSSLGRPEEANKAFLELVARYPESEWAKKASPLIVAEPTPSPATAGTGGR